ncbi:MAG: hypothetical protein QOD70_554 [Frankiales bacterium]|jgi:hypothetical protein|nr:hypothetical protein [Frankiales bacterium]
MVVQEQLQTLAFYDAQTKQPVSQTKVPAGLPDQGALRRRRPCRLTADGRTLVASREFGHRLLRLDVATRHVTGYLNLPHSARQDVRDP